MAIAEMDKAITAIEGIARASIDAADRFEQGLKAARRFVFTPVEIKAVSVDLFWLCERHVKVTWHVERVIRWAGRAR